MLQYLQYTELEEKFNIKSILNSIIIKLKNLFNKIKFGRRQSIKLSDYKLNEQIDLKSRLGYLSEFATAVSLSQSLDKAGLRVTPRSTPANCIKIYNQKKEELVKLKAPSNEIKRQEAAGKIMGDQIFKDIQTNGEDLTFLTFDIEMTGDTGKGDTKADIILTVTKDSKKVVIDSIMASLKAYKSSSINLSNSTFISLIKTIFYDNVSSLPRSSAEFVIKFTKDFGSSKEITRLLDLQNIIGSEMKSGADKASARKTAKASHGEVIEILSLIFKKNYKSQKEKINERMLKMLGFDGEDDFYAAIGDSNKMKIISSRDSKELQNLITQFQNGFDLTITRNGTTNNAFINFTGPDGKVFIKGNITFTDTGGKNAQGKTNTFVDFRQFIKK
jgi:hypothetical protein